MEIKMPEAPELASIIYGQEIPAKTFKEKKNLINGVSKNYQKMFPKEFSELEKKLSGEIEQLCYDRTFCKYAGISYVDIDEHIIDIKTGIAIFLKRNYKKNIETKVVEDIVYFPKEKSRKL
tara:strand:- start:165 stop:527 length:363 start_codon:yes stop_codon:yes gene_type:complete